MEKVYIIAIILASMVIIVIVYLLRFRFKSGQISASSRRGKLNARVDTFALNEVTSAASQEREAPSVDISSNWLVGASLLRVLRDKVVIARNKLIGRHSIEVKQMRGGKDQ